MLLDPPTIALAILAVLLIGFMKGAFGGGFAIIGIPLLALVMDPIAAGALLAPLFVATDLFALRYWRPSTWSRRDLATLTPSQLAGVGLGYLALDVLDSRAVAIVVAAITLGFAALWLGRGGAVVRRPRSTSKAIAAGLGSGVTGMVAHSGGPALALYLLPLGLPKQVYAGTTFLFFAVGNLAKAIPWLLLAQPDQALWTLMALAAPAAPLGVWLGWRLHNALDQTRLYRACYALLIVVALKLLWDGVSGYLA